MSLPTVTSTALQGSRPGLVWRVVSRAARADQWRDWREHLLAEDGDDPTLGLFETSQGKVPLLSLLDGSSASNDGLERASSDLCEGLGQYLEALPVSERVRSAGRLAKLLHLVHQNTALKPFYHLNRIQEADQTSIWDAVFSQIVSTDRSEGHAAGWLGYLRQLPEALRRRWQQDIGGLGVSPAMRLALEQVLTEPAQSERAEPTAISSYPAKPSSSDEAADEGRPTPVDRLAETDPRAAMMATVPYALADDDDPPTQVVPVAAPTAPATNTGGSKAAASKAAPHKGSAASAKTAAATPVTATPAAPAAPVKRHIETMALKPAELDALAASTRPQAADAHPGASDETVEERGVATEELEAMAARVENKAKAKVAFPTSPPAASAKGAASSPGTSSAPKRASKAAAAAVTPVKPSPVAAMTGPDADEWHLGVPVEKGAERRVAPQPRDATPAPGKSAAKPNASWEFGDAGPAESGATPRVPTAPTPVALEAARRSKRRPVKEEPAATTPVPQARPSGAFILTGAYAGRPWGPRILRVVGTVTGLLVVVSLVRVIIRFLLGFRREGRLSLQGDQVVLETSTYLLGREMRRMRRGFGPKGLLSVARETSYPYLYSFIGLVALCLGTLVGTLAYLDGRLAGFEEWMRTGLLLILGGLVVDFLLTVWAASRPGKTTLSVTFEPRTTFRLMGVDEGDAERMLDALVRYSRS